MDTDEKIKNLTELKKIVEKLKNDGKSAAFTNGCFDLLHLGHVKYLQEAKTQADILIVGLNSDRSVNEIKGEGRPITPQADRAGVLAALESVDFVVIFDEPDPLELIKAIAPDVLIKGGDWPAEKIIGKDFVESSGGKVITVPYIKGYSTKSIIEKIAKTF